MASGGKVITLVNFAEVYMEIFLPSSQVTRIAIGADARIKQDVLDIAIPGVVTQAVVFRGADVGVVWPQLLTMVGLGSLFFLGSLTVFRRSVSGS